MVGNNRTTSESSFFEKLKRKGGSLRNKNKSKKKGSKTSTLKRSSLSMSKSGKGKTEIAKRRIITDPPNSSMNISNSSNIQSVADPIIPNLKQNPPLELPDIVSIRSNRSRKSTLTSKSSKHDLDFTFLPRRSIQNSTNGMDKINTGHSYFNIPVTIDDHNNRSKVNLHKKDFTRHTSNPQGKDHQTQPISHNNQMINNNSSTSLFGTILSMAHNAVSHVPKITINESTGLERRVGSHNQDNSENKNGPLANENAPGPNDTVIHSPDGPARSTSFLRHLDYLLAPGNANAESELAENKNSENGTPSASEHNVESNNSFAPMATESNIDPVKTNQSVNEPSGMQSNHDYNKSQLSKVKFEPLSNEPPLISTLGRGNLTLDAFAARSDTDDISDNDEYTNEIATNMNTNNSSNRVSLSNISRDRLGQTANKASALRNSSYIDLTKHNPLLPGLHGHRGRSKTLPTNDVSSSNEPQDENKRNTRYSSLSNEEMLNVDVPERKARSASRNFLSRRSFSPTNIGMKVIPTINLRNSMHKTRNSNEVSNNSMDNQRPRTSTTFSGSVNPVVDIDNRQPFELKGIEYAGEKKNAEFHNLFKDAGLSPQERLIIDHSCALSRDILLQGRIYISDQHICFYSNILGWVSTVFIPFKEIVQIEKKTTAGIFPNGIVIDTLHTKYIFASFISRDATFDLITDVWNQIILGKRYMKNSDDVASGFESGYSTEDNFSEPSDIYDEEDTELDDTDLTMSDGLDDDIFGDFSNGKNGKSPMLATSGPVKHAPTNSNYKPTDNERLVSETVIEAPLGSVAEFLYGDDVSNLEGVLKALKNYDISPIPKLINTKTREFTYTKPLNAGFGPSKTKCFIKENLDYYDLDSYVQVTQESRTPDVPSGNSFVIKTVTLLTWDENNSTKVTVYFSVMWTGKSWLKGAIEKGAYDGVVETTKTQNTEVSRVLKENNLNRKPKNKKSEEDASVLALPTIGPQTHSPTEPDFEKAKEDTIIDSTTNLAAPIGTVFQLLFGDDHQYLKNILEKQDCFDISDIPAFVNNEREYTYIKRLGNAIGPKQTKCVISEKIENMDTDKYIMVKQIVKSPEVPYGNSFSVHVRNYLSWGPDNTTNLLVVSNIVWTGKSLLKGTIERSSLDAQKSGNKIVVEELTNVITNAVQRKKSRKRAKTVKQNKTTKTQDTKTSVAVSSSPQQSGLLASILDLNTGLPSINVKSVLMFFAAIFFFYLLRGIFTSKTTSNIELVSPGRILIDGNEYSYIPNFKTLYQVYEDSVSDTARHGNHETANVVKDSEESIWKWLNDRGVESSEILEKIPSDKKERLPKTKERKEMKKLMDSIEVTELQLKEMKAKLQLMSS